MEFKFVLTDYIQQAMARAEYENLDDGTFRGIVPDFAGLFALGNSQPECQEELQSGLEDWILAGLKQDNEMPVVAGIDLNFDITTPVPEENW